LRSTGQVVFPDKAVLLLNTMLRHISGLFFWQDNPGRLFGCLVLNGEPHGTFGGNINR
jgi:hypothetical protein